MTTTHFLMIPALDFLSILEGRKTFDIRMDNQDYQDGDLIIFREFISYGEKTKTDSEVVSGKDAITGRELTAEITYIDDYKVQTGYVALAFKVLNKPKLNLAKAHFIKELPQYFDDVLTGKKTFEIRKNDRDYRVGDTVTLREYQPELVGTDGKDVLEVHSGRTITVKITYVTDYEQKPGYIVFGFKILSKSPSWKDADRKEEIDNA